MSDVKWIKITTDIFDDEKILLIESLPDADAIIVIWFKLLCLAGKTNNSGVFILNDIAYTDKMLSTIFRRKESTVQLALETFRKFGMIDILDGVITIPNWGKHQNLDEMERRKEYMRNYMTEYRDKQKGIACKTNSKVNSKVNSKANVNCAEGEGEEEGDVDREGEERESREKAPAPGKKTSAKNKSVDNSQRYGLYNNVILSDDERDALMNAYPDSYAEKIDNLSAYMVSKNKVYHNHFATIMKWAREDEKEQKQKEQPSKYPPRQGSAEDLKNFSKMLDEIGERMKGKNNDV